MVGVLAAVALTVCGTYANALDDVDQAARVQSSAQRLSVPQVATERVSTTTVPADSTVASAVVALLNTERASRGLAPYAAHSQVIAAAQVHSDDMAGRNRMDHTGSDGSTAGDRLEAPGFQWGAYGENVAAGQPTAQQVVTSWMNSSGHRPQMLGNYEYVGVGVAAGANGTLYWTLVVAS